MIVTIIYIGRRDAEHVSFTSARAVACRERHNFQIHRFKKTLTSKDVSLTASLKRAFVSFSVSRKERTTERARRLLK